MSGNGSKKHTGIRSHGKGAGTGAMTDIETEQLRDHSGNRYPWKAEEPNRHWTP